MRHEELPLQCQHCLYLNCGYVRMNGDNEYRCRKVICFLKYKEENCKEYKVDFDLLKRDS